MSDTITRQQLDKWTDWLVGKSCPKHPQSLIKKGCYGNWCGNKDSFGYCDGGWPTEEFLKLNP